jgi:hypothetical protein
LSKGSPSPWSPAGREKVNKVDPHYRRCRGRGGGGEGVGENNKEFLQVKRRKKRTLIQRLS